jgi:hypothetical protein
LKSALRSAPVERAHYELAAYFFNTCRSRGIQGSNTDFLICAVASRRSISIFSIDRDFGAYEKMLDIRRHPLGD